MCNINDSHMMYGSWDMEHDRQNFLSFWTIFWPLQQCTKNHDHMLYWSWDMVHGRCNYLIYWIIELDVINWVTFCPFALPTAQKTKIWIKMRKKKHLEKSSFYTSVPKVIIICYNVPEIWCVTDVIVIFHLGLFFAHLPP